MLIDLALTHYCMDLDSLVQKFETWNVIYIWIQQLKNIFLYFLELAFRLYKSVDYWQFGIAMRNLVNYDSTGPVPIGIVMQNPVNYEWL